MFYEKLLITALTFSGEVLAKRSSYPQEEPWLSLSNQPGTVAKYFYDETCLMTWTHVPSKEWDESRLKLMRNYNYGTQWHQQHNLPIISWKMFSDLYETSDQLQWNRETGDFFPNRDYLIDSYDEHLPDILSSKSFNWEVSDVLLAKEISHWISPPGTDKQDRFSGLNSQSTLKLDETSYTNDPLAYHGYKASNELQSVGVEYGLKDIRKVHFNYAVESLKWVEDFAKNEQIPNHQYIFKAPSNGILYDQTSWWAQLTDLERFEDGSSQTSNIYLDQIYHRVFQVCFDGFDKNSGAPKSTCVGQSAENYAYETIQNVNNAMDLTDIGSVTYDLGDNDQYDLVGFQSWFTQLKNDMNTKQGYRMKETTNVVGWLGLVVLDNYCLRCQNVPAAPSVYITQGTQCDSVKLTWNAVADMNYKVTWGPSASDVRSEKIVSAKDGQLIVPADGYGVDKMVFTVAVADCPSGCTCNSFTQTYNVPVCLPGCATITGKLGETADSLSLSFQKSNFGIAATGFDVKQRIVGSQSWTTITRLGVSDTRFTASKLVPGTNYEFLVEAFNSIKGAAQNCQAYTVFFNPTICPTAIKLGGEVRGCSGFTLNWSTQNSPSNAQAFSNYELQMLNSQNSFVTVQQSIFGSSTQLDQINQQPLAVNTDFTFRVIGNAQGCPQVSSDQVKLRIESTVAPQVKLVSESCQGVGIEWTGGSHNSWQLQYAEGTYYQNNLVWSNVKENYNFLSRSYSFGAGQSGKSYNFRLITTVATQCGMTVSNTVFGTVAVQSVPTIQAQSTCSGFKIDWQGGISNMQLQYANKQSNSGWQNVASWSSLNIAETGSTTVSQLTQGQSIASGSLYTFRFTGTGTCGQFTSLETMSVSLISDSAPTLYAVAQCNSIQFTVASGASTKLQMLSSGNSWIDVREWNSNQLSVSLNTLNGQNVASGASYSFRLSAVGTCGTVYSQTQFVQIQAQVAPQITATATCNGMVITWDKVPNGSMQLQYKTQFGSWQNVDSWNWNSVMASNQNSFGVTSISNNQPIQSSTSYTFRLEVQTQCGAIYSNEREARSLAETTVPALTASTKCGTVNFSWGQSQNQLQLQYRDNQGQWRNVESWTQSTQQAGQFQLSQLSATENFTPNVPYLFRLASNGVCGQATSLETAVTISSDSLPTLLAQPTCDGVIINWSSPSGSAKLLYREANTQTWLNVDSWVQQSASNSMISSVTIKTLSNNQPVSAGKYYQFKLTSTGQCGTVESQVRDVYITPVQKPYLDAWGYCNNGDGIQLKLTSGFDTNYMLQYHLRDQLAGSEWVDYKSWTPTQFQNTMDIKQLNNGIVIERGKSYSFRVVSVSGSNSCAQNSNEKLVIIPTQTNPTLTAQVTCSQIQLSWSLGPEAFDSYIEYQQDNGIWQKVTAQSSSATTMTISSLNNVALTSGKQYRFRISQTGICGSTYGYADVVVPATASAPSISALASCNSITISWFGQYAANELQLQQSTSGQDSSWSNVNQQISGNQVTISNLQTSVTYYFRMQRTGNCGTDVSQTVFAKIEPVGKSQLYAVADSCGGSINLQWNLATGVNDFSIEYLASNNNWATVVTKTQLGFTSLNNYVVTSLGNQKPAAGQTYTFRLKGSGTCGASISDQIQAYVPVITAPTLILSGQCSNYQLRWQGGSGSNSYSLQYQLANSNQWTNYPNFSTQTSLNSFTLTSGQGVNFEAGRSYQFRLVSNGACGSGQNSNIVDVVFAATAATPTNLSLNVYQNQVCLSWNQAQVPGATVQEYIIQQQTAFGDWATVSTQCSGNSQQCCYQTSNYQSSTTCTDLTVKIAAKSVCGTSQFSVPTNKKTQTAPGSPTSLARSDTAYSESQITVGWAKPSFDGCSPITHYVVYYTAVPCVNFWTNALGTYYPDYTWTRVQNQIPANQLTYTLARGVMKGERYSFSVEACNAIGCGPKSASFTTVALAPPSAPIAPSAKNVGGDMLELTWTRPQDNWITISGYEVQVNGMMSNNARCFFQEAQTTQCLLMLDHLRAAPFSIQAGQDFSMKIIANSHQGNSPASTAVSYRMTADQCGPVSFVAQVDRDETESANDDFDVEEVTNDYGLTKNEEDNQDSTEEASSTDDRVNLALQFTTTETASNTTEGQGAISFGLGVACTLLLQAVIACGYYLYKKKQINVAEIEDGQPGSCDQDQSRQNLQNDTASLSRSELQLHPVQV